MPVTNSAPGTSPPSLNYQAIPTTEAPYQVITVTLGNQACQIALYTKSINVPFQDPMPFPIIPTVVPPVYENVNPVFIDLYANGALIIGGVLALNDNLIVRNTYLGFVGDLAVIDTSGAEGDPYGVPSRLPPPDLRNWWQRTMPQVLGGQFAPSAIAQSIPGMGSRFILAYWPNLT